MGTLLHILIANSTQKKMVLNLYYVKCRDPEVYSYGTDNHEDVSQKCIHMERIIMRI